MYKLKAQSILLSNLDIFNQDFSLADYLEIELQVAQKSYNWWMAWMQQMWLHVGVHVMHLGLISTVAVGSLLTQTHVGLQCTQPSSREPVQRPIAMHLMMAPALSHAKELNIQLHSAPLTGYEMLFLIPPRMTNFY